MLVVPPSLTAVTVSPALVLPKPVVITDLLLNLAANFRNWDFPVPDQIKYVKTSLYFQMIDLVWGQPSDILERIRNVMESKNSKRTE